MASGKRQPSKQKRSNQNRQERAARQARAANAAAASASTSSGSTPAPSRSLLGRLRSATGGTASSSGARGATARAASGSSAGSSPKPGGVLGDRSLQPPGYRAALTGVLAAVAAIVFSFFIRTPVDAGGDLYTQPKIVADWATEALHAAEANPSATGAEVAGAVTEWMPNRSEERLPIAIGWLSFAMALPVIGAGLAFRAVRQRRPSKVVNRAMYATLLGVFLTADPRLLQMFFVTIIAVGVAGFQVRKAEVAAARAAAASGGAIDVQEVEPADGAAAEVEVVDVEVVDGTDEGAAPEAIPAADDGSAAGDGAAGGDGAADDDAGG